MSFCLVYSQRERLGICHGYDSYPLFSHLALLCCTKVHLLHLNLSVTFKKLITSNTSICSSFLNLLSIFSKFPIFWHREWIICSEMWNYSHVQNKIWDWATELKKIQSVKKPPLLCCEHGTKVTDVCSPETMVSAPLPALCLQRSALLLHPSAYIKLTSCWSLKLGET